MLLISHRINTISDLPSKGFCDGIEIDLRYKNNEIILHHDPFCDGEIFEEFLKKFNLHFMILNIKSEGIEEEVIRLVKKYKIPDYFILDSSIPFIVKYI